MQAGRLGLGIAAVVDEAGLLKAELAKRSR
jgi:hypothetical protein